MLGNRVATENQRLTAEVASHFRSRMPFGVSPQPPARRPTNRLPRRKTTTLTIYDEGIYVACGVTRAASSAKPYDPTTGIPPYFERLGNHPGSRQRRASGSCNPCRPDASRLTPLSPKLTDVALVRTAYRRAAHDARRISGSGFFTQGVNRTVRTGTLHDWQPDSEAGSFTSPSSTAKWRVSWIRAERVIVGICTRVAVSLQHRSRGSSNETPSLKSPLSSEVTLVRPRGPSLPRSELAVATAMNDAGLGGTSRTPFAAPRSPEQHGLGLCAPK